VKRSPGAFVSRFKALWHRLRSIEGCAQHIRCPAAHQHPLQSNCCKIYVQKWLRIFISLSSKSNSCYNRIGQIKEGESNMKIQSVAILGAGAVGSYIIWGLSKKDNIRLGVIAEGDRARRLKESGCAINGAVYRPEVWTPQEAQGVDLLVVALKYGSLPGALESIKTAVGSNTVVMSLMNGVDSEELIAAQVGAEHLLYSFIKVTSHKEADGYHFDPDATLGVIYGERFAPFESERVEAVRELFTDSWVNFRVTEHIQEEMWSKFRLNVCNNLPQAILGAGVGCYRDSVHMKAISDGLRRELEAIATARGIDLRIADAVSHGCAVPATARYSTLQDLDAGRHTEIDMFSGALMRMGKELGIPTPYNEYTYHMIKAMEEKNDGLFDYDGTEEPTWAK
jgi:2-dehydropantoate 2-reductase